jgi:hypothetical protein
LPEPLAAALVGFIGLYAGLGILVALWLEIRGLGRLDEGAEGAGIGLRLLLFPGLVAFWPVLLVRTIRGVGPPNERNPHRDAARGDS